MGNTFICVGCGKVIARPSEDWPGDQVARVQIGRLAERQQMNGKRRRGRPRSVDSDFNHESTWGLMHFMCFLRAIDSADAVFAELGG